MTQRVWSVRHQIDGNLQTKSHPNGRDFDLLFSLQKGVADNFCSITESVLNWIRAAPCRMLVARALEGIMETWLSAFTQGSYLDLSPNPARARLWMALLALAFSISCSGRELPALNVDLAETSVSGLSSGAFMAVQFEVAHSAIVKGVGVIAGGPYYCGQNDAIRATTQCSCSLDTPFPTCNVSSISADVPHLESITRALAHDGTIDPPTHLANHRVFIFTGGKDSIVPGAIAAQLEEYYQRFSVPAGNITKTVQANAAHTMPTRNYGASCSVSDTPYIGKCGFDGAYAALSWIYRGLNPPRQGTRTGRFVQFDQAHYVPQVAPFADTGMDATAWLYVPAACARGERCRLHIALHGCKQAQSYTPLKGSALHYGTRFVRHAGYVETADTNRIVVLFPQVVPSPGNIFGCWDWWGYTGADYANKNGVQIATIRAMAEQIALGRH